MEWLRNILRKRVSASLTSTARAPELWDYLASCDVPTDFSGFEAKIREHFKLYRRNWPHRNQPERDAQLQAELNLLSANWQVASAFIFHGDGLIREAALNSLNRPLDLPIMVYGIVCRLNDWSPQVRQSAARAVSRCFGISDAQTLMPAVWVLLSQAQSWARWAVERREYDPFNGHLGIGPQVWSEGYSAFVTEVMNHSTLVSALVGRLCSERGGGTTPVLKAMSRSPAFDPFLLDIAQRANQPHLRAAALSVLTSRRATWPLSSFSKQWVNKAMGEYRMVPDFGYRAITVTPELAPLLKQALADRSVMVRRQAIDALTALRQDLQLRGLIEECLIRFAEDPVPALRKRWEYLAKVAVADE